MAYFPNGTAGMVLDEQCGECLLPDDAPCPILLVQLNYNYEQIDKDGKENKIAELVNHLVDEKGVCQMAPLLAKFKTSPNTEALLEKYAMVTLRKMNERDIASKL